jgi:hypothetical protein
MPHLAKCLEFCVFTRSGFLNVVSDISSATADIRISGSTSAVKTADA